MITTPEKTIPGILKECGEKKVAGAIIVAGGIRELGERGRVLEENVVETAKKANIRLSGPNTSGTIINNAKAYHPDADIRGVLVAPMAGVGLEVIIGTKTDEQFGPVIMYGLGGIMVEIMRDVTFWVLPIGPSSSRRIIENTRSSVILKGIRGQEGYDRKSLRKLLQMCSELIESYPEIEEMDLNPVVLYRKGLDVVDARIILKEGLNKESTLKGGGMELPPWQQSEYAFPRKEQGVSVPPVSL